MIFVYEIYDQGTQPTLVFHLRLVRYSFSCKYNELFTIIFPSYMFHGSYCCCLLFHYIILPQKLHNINHSLLTLMVISFFYFALFLFKKQNINFSCHLYQPVDSFQLGCRFNNFQNITCTSSWFQATSAFTLLKGLQIDHTQPPCSLSIHYRKPNLAQLYLTRAKFSTNLRLQPLCSPSQKHVAPQLVIHLPIPFNHPEERTKFSISITQTHTHIVGGASSIFLIERALNYLDLIQMESS